MEPATAAACAGAGPYCDHCAGCPTRETAGMTEPLSDADYIRLGRILERFIKQDGVTYWGVGEDNRPHEDGQEGGMTIDMSVTISAPEAALLDRVGEPW